MFEDQPILIVEDNVYVALDLSSAVEERQGRVVGPAGSVSEALHLIDNVHVAAAILDFHLPDGDASSVAAKLAGKGVPFVIHTECGLPAAFAELHGDVPILQKPVDPHSVLTTLHGQILGNSAEKLHPRLGDLPKQV
jgi:two-component system, response regulator PdtaR